MASLMDAVVESGIKGIGEGLGSLLKDVRAAWTGKSVLDATAAAEIEFKILELKANQDKAVAEMEKSLLLAQIDLLKADAVSTDKYQSRPRPTVMWICCAGLVYSFLIHPLLPWLVAVGGIIVHSIWPSIVLVPLPALPGIDTATLVFGLLIPLLGLAGMRTYEKKEGVSK